MRGSLLAGMTTRGTSFLAAGAASAVAGYLLGERGLFCVGIALLALPLFAAAAARRGQYRLATSRTVSPPRVPAGHTATVTLRLENVSRVPTGLLMAEDTVPYALGTRPRYVLDKIERAGVRELTYPLRSDLRGRFEIGPLHLRVADAFGLVELSRSLSGRTTFVVTPRVIPLARTVISRSWAGEGNGRARLTSTAGEDDVIPRAYRDGDEFRRVHWRSTARYGELMVRREEQRWRNKATVFLDSRSMAHVGSGAASSFEVAVSAAASVGVHIAQEGLTGQFISDEEVIRSVPFFEDRLLDALAVIRPSAKRSLASSLKELRASSAGVIIAVMGRISVAEAQQLAVCRGDGSQGIALLLDVSSWADQAVKTPDQQAVPASSNSAVGSPVNDSPANGSPANGSPANGSPANGSAIVDSSTSTSATTASTGNGRTPPAARSASRQAAAESLAAAAVLRGAGWHVTLIDASTPLAVAWQRLPRAAEMLVAATASYRAAAERPDGSPA
ncbi:MAG TPA: DUF58 domain-containing protein [Streptosporangiaceae bacterium]|nr:DUF58 domain-containing protein [Streptosporangiaceae bacterium]